MSKSKLAPFFAACIVAAISSGSLRAQECQLLQDTIDTGSTSKLRAAHFHKACTQSYEEFDRSWGAKAKGEYLGIGGSGEYNKKNYRKWFNNKCTEINNEEHRSASYYLSQRFLSNNALEAYKTCLARSAPLVCLAEPNGQDIDFLISWNEISSLGKLKSIALRGGHVFGTPLNPGATIDRGDFRLSVIPNNPRVPVRITLNISYGVGASVSCRAYAVVRPLVPKSAKPRKPRKPRLMGIAVAFSDSELGDHWDRYYLGWEPTAKRARAEALDRCRKAGRNGCYIDKAIKETSFGCLAVVYFTGSSEEYLWVDAHIDQEPKQTQFTWRTTRRHAIKRCLGRSSFKCKVRYLYCNDRTHADVIDEWID